MSSNDKQHPDVLQIQFTQLIIWSIRSPGRKNTTDNLGGGNASVFSPRSFKIQTLHDSTVRRIIHKWKALGFKCLLEWMFQRVQPRSEK